MLCLRRRHGSITDTETTDKTEMAIRTLGDVVRRSEPLVTVQPTDSVIELARVLHEKRVDAVAVLRNDNEFVGLITSRDIASCVARRDELSAITAESIMTTSPITLSDKESPVRALSIMRSGRFRHIPVLLDNKKLIGIVDVLHLAYDAITRLQASYDMIPSRRTFDFLRAARATIEKPTLRPIVEASPLVTLNRKNTVTEACEAIVRNHLAAVVIVDEHGILDGIFTCRDVSTRVVAKELDPDELLENVMTLNPDSASPDFTILESLQRMQACSYRHLPVVEDHSRKVVGLVNVLQLASDALLETSKGEPNCSSSSIRSSPSSPRASGAPSTPRRSPTSSMRSGGSIGSFFSSLFSTATYAPPPLPASKRKSLPPPSRSADKRAFSNLSRREVMYGNVAADTSFISFKFRDMNDEFRKVRVPSTISPGAFDQLVIDVRRRFFGSSKSTNSIKIKYIDEDGDAVLIGNDEDLAACLADARQLKGKNINLQVTAITSRSDGSNASGSRGPSVPNSPQFGGMYTPKHLSPPSAVTPSIHTASPQSSSVTSEPPAPPPTESEIKTQSAHALMMNNRIEESISLLNEAIKLDSGNARALGNRGAARLISGDSTGAEEDYRRAISLLESQGEADNVLKMCVSGLVEALIDQRRYEEALNVASREDAQSALSGCVDAFQDELDNNAKAARSALETGDFAEAMTIYSNALRVENAYLTLSPGAGARAGLRVGRAKCYAKLEDYDMALEDYEAAKEIEPESVAAIKGCARCLQEMEQPERAKDMWELAHKLDCGDEEASRELQMLRGTSGVQSEDKTAEIKALSAKLGAMFKN